MAKRPSDYFTQMLKEHMRGGRPPSALVDRIARQFIYGSRSTEQQDDKPSSDDKR